MGYTFASWDDCVCLENSLKCRANPFLGASLDHSSCMVSPTIVCLRENHKEIQKRKLDGHECYCFLLFFLSSVFQNLLALKHKPHKTSGKDYVLILWLQLYIHSAANYTSIVNSLEYYCILQHPNKQFFLDMWSKWKRGILHCFFLSHSPYQNWGHPWVSPISSTVSTVLFLSHAHILPTKATDSLQSFPHSLSCDDASKETSWASFNICWNIRFFEPVPTLNYIWYH